MNNESPEAKLAALPKVKVYVSVLSMGNIRVDLVDRLLCWARQRAHIAATVGVVPVDHARNQAVRDFLKTDCTHILFVDEDTVPPRDAVDKMLAVDADLVTGITQILKHSEEKNYTVSNVFLGEVMIDGKECVDTAQENTGIIDFNQCGASCLMIKRSVFLKMDNPWFEFKWTEGHMSYLSEDLYFSDKARALGLSMKCDTSIMCDHYKVVNL